MDQKTDTEKGHGKYSMEGLWGFLRQKFSLEADKASESDVKDNIRKGVDFQGPNLWILIFATFIASLGLNVNSVAVIIGAMLISPLMGPIMGIGLSVGINDFELMKRSLRNFGFMVLISILTSTFYFLISPLSNASSEMLARTSPTMYDVLIAFFGGLAGMVAQTRKDRTSTVISGVAIATALMPPLCTAGYGIATLQIKYFFGAFYLFFINTVFIALAAFIVVRSMKYSKKEFLDAARERQVKRYLTLISVVTLIPSIIIGYDLVKDSVFESAADKYVKDVMKFPRTQIIDYKKARLNDGSSYIELVMLGEKVSEDAIENARLQMPNYGLVKTTLSIHQAGDTGNADFSSLQTGYKDLLVEKNKRITELETLIASGGADGVPAQDVTRELTVISPNIQSAYVARSLIYGAKSEVVDTMVVCVVKLSGDGDIDRARVEDWLRARTKTKKIKLYTE